MIVFSALATAQITLVHVTSCEPAASPATCAIPSTAAGHLIAVGVVAEDATATVSGVSDNSSNNYAEATAGPSIDTNAGYVADIWYAKNSSAGATTITVTPGGGGAIDAIVVWEFSGVDTASPLDQSAVLSNQPATMYVTGAAVTATSVNELVISVGSVESEVTGIASGSSFTNDATAFSDGWAHLITGTPGAYAAQWVSDLGSYSSVAATFKPIPITSSCDVNGDGSTNVVDVQLISNMETGALGAACTVNVGGALGCTDYARQVVIKAALGKGCHFVQLTWAPSSSAGVTGYNIYRGTAPGAEGSTPINSGGPVPGTSYTDVTAASGSTYYYVLTATSSGSESAPSGEFCVTSNPSASSCVPAQ